MGEFAKIAKKRKVAGWSWNLVARTGDLILLTMQFGVYFPTTTNRAKFFQEIENHYYQPIDEAKIQNCLYRLKRRGFIDYTKRLWQEPRITEQGEKRLKAILPQYDGKRIWEKHLYLITYDIPVKKNQLRNQLRQVLKTLGCGLLQKSVWLTPYNPKKVLEDFVAEKDLAGLVLVSDLGRDGSIGEEDNRRLVERVYHLDELNQRYEEFFKRWQKKKPKPEMLPHFFSILKDDPQLPFALLPDDWLGEKAWELISPKFKI